MSPPSHTTRLRPNSSMSQTRQSSGQWLVHDLPFFRASRPSVAANAAKAREQMSEVANVSALTQTITDGDSLPNSYSIERNNFLSFSKFLHDFCRLEAFEFWLTSNSHSDFDSGFHFFENFRVSALKGVTIGTIGVSFIVSYQCINNR